MPKPQSGCGDGPERRVPMKYAGLLVMPSGFFLSVAALVLFPPSPLRVVFVICGLLVEGLGLGVALRGHMERRRELEPLATVARGADLR